MGYPFVNTIIKRRSVDLPITRLKSLSTSGSRSEILEALSRFGIQNSDMSLSEANLTLGNFFRLRLGSLSNRLRGTPFLFMLTKRFDILQLIDFITNFTESRVAVKLVSRLSPINFERVTDLNSLINEINRLYRFNINPNYKAGDARDELLRQYLARLAQMSGHSSRSLINKERFLLNLPHRADYLHFLSEHKNDWFYRFFNGNSSFWDIKAIFYLYNTAKKASIEDPLGELVPLYYTYYMDLTYKFAKALYFSIKENIKLDFEEAWET